MADFIFNEHLDWSGSGVPDKTDPANRPYFIKAEDFQAVENSFINNFHLDENGNIDGVIAMPRLTYGSSTGHYYMNGIGLLFDEQLCNYAGPESFGVLCGDGPNQVAIVSDLSMHEIVSGESDLGFNGSDSVLERHDIDVSIMMLGLNLNYDGESGHYLMKNGYILSYGGVEYSFVNEDIKKGVVFCDGTNILVVYDDDSDKEIYKSSSDFGVDGSENIDVELFHSGSSYMTVYYAHTNKSAVVTLMSDYGYSSDYIMTGFFVAYGASNSYKVDLTSWVDYGGSFYGNNFNLITLYYSNNNRESVLSTYVGVYGLGEVKYIPTVFTANGEGIDYTFNYSVLTSNSVTLNPRLFRFVGDAGPG